MNRPYILREDFTWLMELEQLQARQRAEMEGFGDVFWAAAQDAGCHDLATVDISSFPAWAQEKLREWYGDVAA